MRRRLVTLICAAAVAAGVSCRRTLPPVNEVVAVPAAETPLNPSDGAWNQAPEHIAKLLLQDLVEPRLMKPSTAEVRVQAITDGSNVAFRLRWVDPLKNDLPGPGRFADACAVQVPRKLEPTPPDPQMGQVGRTVDIVFWRADWQASVDGRGDTIRDLYPNATVDHYPFQAKPLEEGSALQREMAKRYAPAEAAGNRRTGPRKTPVEDLVAEGPGTLSRSAEQTSNGRGERTKDGWAVVIKRKIPDGLAPKSRTQIAFAVWEGSHQETGARKMRTGWIPFAVREPK